VTTTREGALPVIPGSMRAWLIHHLGPLQDSPPPLLLDTITTPEPGFGELLIAVHACGVCHTEIDEIEGRAAPATLPMIPGHQVVGTVVSEGPGCNARLLNSRVGVAWIHSACGNCEWCLGERENLCPDFIACGKDVGGGYAEFMVVRESFVYRIPLEIQDCEATTLLCAGAVGYRSLRMCELANGEALGLTGFGASGHLVLQMARFLFPDSQIHVFARSERERKFALSLGAVWAGDTSDRPPRLLNAIIDTTPAWLPVICAMEYLCPGGRLVINAIRKEPDDQQALFRLDYERHLWREKSIRTVANVTRKDVSECLSLAAKIPLQPSVEKYPFEAANDALLTLKGGHIRGAKVLCIR